MPYYPPSVRRAAEAAGLSVEEFVAAQKAAAAPRELGPVPRHAPRRARSRSSSGRRTAVAKGRRGLSVRHHNRRVRISNGGHGVNELHPRQVDPFDEGDNYRSANFRLMRPVVPMTNFSEFDQRKRRKTLRNVMDRRAGMEGKAGRNMSAINAALADLSARASLNAANAVAIASIGERLYDIIDSNT